VDEKMGQNERKIGVRSEEKRGRESELVKPPVIV